MAVDAVADLVDLGIAGACEQVVAAAGVGGEGQHRVGELGVEGVAGGDVDCAPLRRLVLEIQNLSARLAGLKAMEVTHLLPFADR